MAVLVAFDLIADAHVERTVAMVESVRRQHHPHWFVDNGGRGGAIMATWRSRIIASV